MNTILEKKVTIIGAGLTGLTLGFLLKHRNIEFIIIEKESRAGGVISTKQHDGFTYETGPNTGIIAHPEVVELFEMLAPECEIELADPKAENRWILKNGKWKNLPSGLISGIFNPLFSLYDKFRILGEPFRKRGTNPMESVSDLVKRRMGQSFLDYAVDPFISGIYAGDTNQLVTQFALPKLYALEQKYGSFIKGAIKKGREPKTERDLKASRKVFAAKGGFNNLIQSLTRQIETANIIYSASNLKISYSDSAFLTYVNQDNEKSLTIHSQKLITTSGGHSLADLFDFIDSEELSPITELEYARVVQVILAYNKWNGPELNAFGGLVPSKEKRNFLGVLFPSSIFRGRTPEGGALLSVFMGGVKRPEVFDMNDAEIYKLADMELSNLFDLPKSDLAFREVYRYRHAIPQYDKKSPERLKRISELQTKYPELLLAGNIRDGIGIGDRIKQAFDISGLIT